MEDHSTTYQAIIAKGDARGEARGRAEGKAEGQAEEARKLLLRIGLRRFGAPSDEIAHAVEAVTDIAALETLVERATMVESWSELFD